MSTAPSSAVGVGSVHVGPAGRLLGREPVFTIRGRLIWSVGRPGAKDWTGATVTRTTMATVSPRAARIPRQILIPGRDQPQSGDWLVRWPDRGGPQSVRGPRRHWQRSG